MHLFHRRPYSIPISLLILMLATLAFERTAHADEIVNLGRGNIVVQVPPFYDPAEPLPLVILLHGYGASGGTQEAYMRFTPVADDLGFFLAYPNGTVDNNGARFWNATDACCNFFGSNVDDSGYLLDLIDEIKSILSVDEDRVHFVGHSNGGFMSYRMACDHADVVASIASLAGATFKNPNDCAPTSPVHALQIHGTADNVIFYNGGNLLGVQYPGAVETVEQWAFFGGCTITPDTSAPSIDLDSSLPGNETTVTRYEADCSIGGSSELWTIQGGAHSPSLATDFSRQVAEWLLLHPRSAPTCFTGTVNSNVGAVEDVVFLNGTAGGAERTVQVNGGDSIQASIVKPSGGGNGKFVVHANAGTPRVSGQSVLPFDVGLACFDLILPAASPLAVWNNIGKVAKVGASTYFDGSPLPDPARAPTTFLDLPTGDATNLPPGTKVTLQAVLFDPGSVSPKRASTTNALVLEVL